MFHSFLPGSHDAMSFRPTSAPEASLRSQNVPSSQYRILLSGDLSILQLSDASAPAKYCVGRSGRRKRLMVWEARYAIAAYTISALVTQKSALLTRRPARST